METKLPIHALFDYDDRFQQMNIVADFFESGIAGGSKCLYITSENTPYHALKMFDNCGIDAVKYTGSGALEILSAEDTYLVKGYFDPENTLRLFMKFAEDNLKNKFKSVFFAGDMTWASRNISEIHRLMDYERQVNESVKQPTIAAVCMYNRNFFSPEIINELIRLHPHRVSNDGKLRKNTDFHATQNLMNKYLGRIIKGKSNFL